MIGIIDYGMGNLHSVKNACDHLHLEAEISDDPAFLKTCDKLILPGVGAIKDCMNNLKKTGLYEFVIDQTVHEKKPILGICLGMQAFFEHSDENGGADCFGFIKGNVARMSDPSIRIPHIGWNEIQFTGEHPLKSRAGLNPYVYFDHSYFGTGMDENELIAYARHGSHLIPAVVGKENVLGCQFHPEKSAGPGLAVLEYFGKEFS